jgi:glycosyltransferase involved in cell wall biosynthesis
MCSETARPYPVEHDQTLAPSVELLMAVRGPAPWLEQTLSSLAAQTLATWSFICVLDGPDRQIHDQVLSRMPSARILTMPAETGLVGCLNAGVAHGSAPLIARLDADDLAHPERLATQQRFLADHSDYVVLGTSLRLIDAQGRSLGHLPGPDRAHALRRLRWRSAIAHPSVMMRRSALEQVGGYRPEAKGVEDFDLWLRMATVGTVGSLPDELTHYRIHAGQVSRTARFSDSAQATLLDARLQLASARGESRSMARVRHAVWATAQRWSSPGGGFRQGRTRLREAAS